MNRQAFQACRFYFISIASFVIKPHPFIGTDKIVLSLTLIKDIIIISLSRIERSLYQ